MAKVTYAGETATHEWLCRLAKLPGQVWIENRNGHMIIVHEFEDLNEPKRSSNEPDLGTSDALQEDSDRRDPAVDRVGQH